ncbi:hypothetical protein C8J56DRAFT_863789 [Mycena floridula]|nr:hypothetical protein C8J56DRAFT_863789 [Mycena floridula]
MQPSQYEIQREVEALRDLRRRSTTPGALALDPDLPNPKSPTSPTAPYWSGAEGESSGSSSHEESSSSELSSPSSSTQSDDPFHLFWVPASVHPEIAPAEFRAFLKEHARSPDGGSTLLSRANSGSSLGLGRKKSMLSRQYRPAENDGVEEDVNIVPLARSRSSLRSNQGPQLTISDLQRLEELAEEASTSDDPSKLRNILRRSLSLNVSPTALDRMDNIPEMGDEADAPIIVPPPGQILRRAARTKIRKPGLPGDGGGHRFSATRRGPRSETLPTEKRISSDISSSDHGESVENLSPRPRAFSNETPRPESFSEEGLIYDSYVRDEDEEILSPVVVTESPPQSPVSEPVEIEPALLEMFAPILHHPSPQILLSPQPPPEQQLPSRSPSPSELSTSTSEFTPASEFISSTQTPPSTSSPVSPSTSRKEKDKKGLFGKWGGDKAAKKSNKDKDKERERVEKEKEKETSFFGSLFGGSKKSKDSDSSSQSLGGAAGREAAQALLGASKSAKGYMSPMSPSQPLPPGVNNYSRYPIHVERAIYRLSHIKLANPRRPLYEQVLISNLMFWYLGVINKAQAASPPNGQAPGANGAPPVVSDQERMEREQQERAEKEKMEQEQIEKERLERERELEMKRKEGQKRGSLTKAAPAGRRAETPVKGPQYEMQHRVMEQEYGYGGYNNGQNSSRNNNPPNNQQYPRQQQYSSGPPKLQLSTDLQSDPFYYNAELTQQTSNRLPPGAMPPVDRLSQPQPGPRASSKSPPTSPHNRSRSPPIANDTAHRSPSRSQSASVLPSSPVNGHVKIRKGTSAYAAVPTSNPVRPRTSEGGEEEDVPLAVWQRQQRR